MPRHYLSVFKKVSREITVDTYYSPLMGDMLEIILTKDYNIVIKGPFYYRNFKKFDNFRSASKFLSKKLLPLAILDYPSLTKIGFYDN